MTARGKLLIVAATLAATAAVFSGCETESAASQTVSVSPSYARITSNHSVSLSAAGGWNYHWELSNDSIGYLNKTTGSSVTYTATKDGQTQTVTLKSYYSSDNSAYYQAQATIVQGDEDYAATAGGSSTSNGSHSGGGSGGGGDDDDDDDDDDDGGDTPSFKLSRSSMSIRVGETGTLSVSGAAGTPRWAITADNKAAFRTGGSNSTTANGTSVTIVGLATGTTTVTVINGGSSPTSQTCHVTVTQ